MSHFDRMFAGAVVLVCLALFVGALVCCAVKTLLVIFGLAVAYCIGAAMDRWSSRTPGA